MHQNHQLQPTSRASLEYARLSATLDDRNHQLHKTEQQMQDMQRLHKKVLIAIAVCALIAFAVFCAAVTLLTGGAA